MTRLNGKMRQSACDGLQCVSQSGGGIETHIRHGNIAVAHSASQMKRKSGVANLEYRVFRNAGNQDKNDLIIVESRKICIAYASGHGFARSDGFRSLALSFILQVTL